MKQMCYFATQIYDDKLATSLKCYFIVRHQLHYTISSIYRQLLPAECHLVKSTREAPDVTNVLTFDARKCAFTNCSFDLLAQVSFSSVLP